MTGIRTVVVLDRNRQVIDDLCQQTHYPEEYMSTRWGISPPPSTSKCASLRKEIGETISDGDFCCVRVVTTIELKCDQDEASILLAHKEATTLCAELNEEAVVEAFVSLQERKKQLGVV